MFTPKDTTDKIVSSFKQDFTVSTLRMLLVVSAIVILVLAFSSKNKIVLASMLAYIALP